MEWILIALLCPLSMGLIMFFMMRGMRQGQRPAEPADVRTGRPEPSVSSAAEVEPSGGG